MLLSRIFSESIARKAIEQTPPLNELLQAPFGGSELAGPPFIG